MTATTLLTGVFLWLSAATTVALVLAVRHLIQSITNKGNHP